MDNHTKRMGICQTINPRTCVNQNPTTRMDGPGIQGLVGRVLRPAHEKADLRCRGCHAFRRGLATNLRRLGVSDKVIQQILRHANVTTTMNIYVKTVSVDAANAMKNLAADRCMHSTGARTKLSII